MFLIKFHSLSKSRQGNLLFSRVCHIQTGLGSN